ncbi:solute carrier family 2, facilitated glucose transporter member 5-like [Pseudonaja textilis]|uniref:solute carrier family 2, facilitated glucose transporter member 5-like n=1 Tax=Pseudonaja textilis TaxID=8673 RepID=UPI000EA90791|nr:solute carrier family 2, facilitated glucose transporter member 5-like [Pseudonaja textilis]
MPQPAPQGPPEKGKMTVMLALVTLIAAFGSSFQYGYNVSVINSPAPFMQQFYNETYQGRYNKYMDESLMTALWSLSVSFFPLGGFFGSLMVGPMVNNCGRKGTLLLNNIFSIIPAILMGISKVAKTFEVIIICRIIIGICAGLSSNVVPMYLGEMSPKNLRGAIGVMPQLFITVGILAAQILGMRMILGSAEGWPLLIGLTGVPAMLQLILLPFCPESPRYLLIQKGDEEGARAGTLPASRNPGCPRLTATIEPSCRPQAIWWMPYISIACVIIYVVGHAIGASPIPSVMIMEMFLQSSRPAAFMVGGSVHWLSNFTVGLVFSYLEQGLGPYCFLIFGAVCLATAVYIFLIVPETKNKTFMEINQIMAKRNGTEDPAEKDELKDFTAVSVPYNKKMDGERSSAL